LSINIAEAKDLDIMAPDMINSEKRRHPYNPDKPVNPYAIIYLNDHKIYETRSKMSTANPVRFFFEYVTYRQLTLTGAFL
jgi:Ca2+-dependent lipid-binding protein